jgi:hypothetical protein
VLQLRLFWLDELFTGWLTDSVCAHAAAATIEHAAQIAEIFVNVFIASSVHCYFISKENRHHQAPFWDNPI